MVVALSNKKSFTSRLSSIIKSALACDVIRSNVISLEMLKVVPAGVELFPNWKVPPTVFFVPVPLIKPRSSSVAAVLGL